MASATALEAGPFDHPALFYRDEQEYLAGVIPFVRDGLERDEPVMVAVPGRNLRAIRKRLGADAERVSLHDMRVAGRNPGRILPGVLVTFARRYPDKPVRIVGEPVWPERTDVEYPACVQHEALINAVFQDRVGAILCPYDVGRLGGTAITDARRTHPVLMDAGGRTPSPDYEDPLTVAGRYNQPLPAPPTDAATMPVAFTSLSEVRRFVTEHAAAAGLTEDQVVDVVLAVNELTTNSVEHAAGAGSLAVWLDGGRFVCQVADGGHITDPLAGRLPSGAGVRGRGLVLVNQVCDLVRVFTRPGATTIRLYMAPDYVGR